MKKILYDLSATQPSPESKFHGGGAYGEVVFFKLSEFHNKRIELICYYDAKNYLNPDIIECCRKNEIKLYDLNTITVEKIIEKENCEIFYSAMLNLNQNIPLEKTKVFTTVHGLRTLEMPYDTNMIEYAQSFKDAIKFRLYMGPAKNYYLKKLKIINGRLVTNDKINVITISNHSLFSIKSFFPETKEKNIPVFASPSFSQLDIYTPELPHDEKKILSDFGLEEKKFFLITSAARWSKNALRAVQAFDELLGKGYAVNFKIVVTGVTRKKIFTKKLIHKENFVFLDYIDRNSLEVLTKNEYAFIYPSLNEGFGYPPVEAMKYGIPSACSGSSSIPEICQNAALYFDPYSTSEMQNRFLQLLDEKIYEELSEKAKKQFVAVSEKQKKDLLSLAEYLMNA